MSQNIMRLAQIEAPKYTGGLKILIFYHVDKKVVRLPSGFNH